MNIHHLRKEINRVYYLALISQYAPTYSGSPQPLSLSELRGLQLFRENIRAWKLLHGHWRCRQLETEAWTNQIKRNRELVKALIIEIEQKTNILDLKGSVLRKLRFLHRFYGWRLNNRYRKLRLKTFLRETGLGKHFYSMHKAGMKFQI